MDLYVRKFKAVADRTRLRILKTLLFSGKRLCICDLIDILGIAQYNLSRHLKELKSAGLVSEERIGRFVFYVPRKDAEDFQRLIFRAIISLPEKLFTEDLKRSARRRLCCDSGGAR